MYNASYDYKVATHSTTQRHRIELKLSNPYVASSVPITLTDDHIEAGTLEVVNQCSDQKDLSPGAVYVGQMSVTIANTTPYISPFLRGQWVGGLCELSFFLLVDEEAGVWEKIPMGFYEIASATWTDRGVKIVAYDFMSRFDKPIDTEIVFGIPWQIVTAICQACGVAYGQTAYDVQNYPNANEILGLYPESGISTYREMLSAVVQCVGGFATIGRDGKLYVRRFGDPQNAVDTFDTDQRIVGAKFSDYSTNYSHLVDGQNEDGLAYEWGDYSGATVNLNGNPFLMYGDEDTRNRQHLAILNEIKRWKYVPFTTSILCGAEYDLGDILRFVGGVAGSLSVGLVNKITWKYKKSYTLNGFGINPRLATLGKRGSGKGSSTSKNGSSQKYFKVTNLGDISWIAEGYEHANDEKTVGVIDFVSSGENIGEFWAQFQLYANTWTGAMDEARIRTRAYLDGEMVAEVIDTLTTAGIHFAETPIYETILGAEMLEPNSHRLSFTMQILDCWSTPTWIDFYIPVGGFRGVLKGYNLKEDTEWDGQLKFEESTNVPNIGLKIIGINDEDNQLTFYPMIGIALADDVHGAGIGIGTETDFQEVVYVTKEQNADIVVCGDGMIAADNRLI